MFERLHFLFLEGFHFGNLRLHVLGHFCLNSFSVCQCEASISGTFLWTGKETVFEQLELRFWWSFHVWNLRWNMLGSFELFPFMLLWGDYFRNLRFNVLGEIGWDLCHRLNLCYCEASIWRSWFFTCEENLLGNRFNACSFWDMSFNPRGMFFGTFQCCRMTKLEGCIASVQPPAQRTHCCASSCNTHELE